MDGRKESSILQPWKYYNLRLRNGRCRKKNIEIIKACKEKRLARVLGSSEACQGPDVLRRVTFFTKWLIRFSGDYSGGSLTRRYLESRFMV